MNQEAKKIPTVALLGICDRARFVQAKVPQLSHTDILGLRKVVVSFVYPFNLSSFSLVLALRVLDESTSGAVILRTHDGNQVFRLDFSAAHEVDISEIENDVSDLDGKGKLMPIGPTQAWSVLTVSLVDVVLTEPQTVQAFLQSEGQDIPLGDLVFGLAEAPPLTDDRRAAIKSDPRSIKKVRIRIGCKHCDTALRVSAALDKPDKQEADEIWYQDVPDFFGCDCGKTHMKLKYIRNNMHALLGQRSVSSQDMTFSALYEEQVIDQIIEDYIKLIDSAPGEEDIQKFLANNPILFHFLAPQRFFVKPSILSKHNADFAVLDGRSTLWFIEIERANTRLIRKDGATAAPMEHALSQVRDWLYQFEHHRGAVLACIDIKPDEVTRARGLVIAGRDKVYDTEKLTKFKWQDRGTIDCMTYDDLLRNCMMLSREMRTM